MIQRLFAFVLLAGACSTYPHEDESTIVALPGSLVNHENPVDPAKRPVDTEGGAFNHEQGPVHPDRFPVDHVKGPVGPERGPYEAVKALVDPERGLYSPEKGPVDPERGPYDTEKGSVDPDIHHHPFPVPNVPVEAPENHPIPQDGPKSDSDLKTDATFWPYYRSYWGHPTYRSYSYWGHPSYYRYYTPRTYYSYYYW